MNGSPICACCGSSDCRFLYQKNRASLHRCRICGLVFVHPVTFSPEDVYTGTSFEAVYGNYERRSTVHRRNFREYLQVVSRYVGGGRLLELGCGFGYFLDVCAGRYDTVGIDLGRPAVEKAMARGHNVVCGDYLTVAIPGKFDAVVMWDFIEHVPTPDALVGRITHNLVPGGYVFLTTGSVDSLAYRLLGRYWRHLQPPWHIFCFNESSLSHLLNKHGLEVLSVSYPPKCYPAGVIVERHLPTLYRSLRTSRIDNVALRVNMHDVMLLVARWRPA